DQRDPELGRQERGEAHRAILGRRAGIFSTLGRMVRGVIIMLAGCRLSSPMLSDDTSGDGPSIDTPVACPIGAMGSGTATTSLGGVGGSERPDLACAANELPIGAGFETTLAPRPEGGGGAAGERVVTAIHVRCADVARMGDGSLAVSARETTEWIANNCTGWAPFVTAPELTCPANTVLVGITANGGALSLFNTGSHVCRPLRRRPT